MNRLTIALTKGRLEEKTVERLERAGIDCTPLRNKGRKLIVSLGDYDVVFAKANDVVTYVEYGVADVGVVGKDTLLELNRPVFEVMDLGFGKCRFGVATQGGKDIYSADKLLTVATKYPEVAKKHFASLNMDVEIIKIEGSVELAPLMNLADAIVDIVETGTTLKENGLSVIRYIADISARLVANPASLKLKKQAVERLTDALKERI